MIELCICQFKFKLSIVWYYTFISHFHSEPTLLVESTTCTGSSYEYIVWEWKIIYFHKVVIIDNISLPVYFKNNKYDERWYSE